jgi:hypothetical protein
MHSDSKIGLVVRGGWREKLAFRDVKRYLAFEILSLVHVNRARRKFAAQDWRKLSRPLASGETFGIRRLMVFNSYQACAKCSGLRYVSD